MCNRSGEKNQGPKGGSNKMVSSKICKLAQNARIQARKLVIGAATIDPRKAKDVARELSTIEGSIERIVAMVGETTCVTLRPVLAGTVVAKKASSTGRRRRRNRRGAKSLTQRVCDDLRTFGRQNRRVA